ncbi:ABC transporter substrate-binding protein [Microbacterium sp. CFBP9034]|uniref:ABC transporter substrate-binding protein n=1 Tax=Microbacterium sp. CFBP9034 TaxID=3096540 RepID=UPI002A6991F4|nr:ABC transporter substrate-binding protein [Microbacterium sp. CFBP9034]MDY0910205.1 ABC transporter substrate-binding protein [Microbacterium sp. CFBP9034]
MSPTPIAVRKRTRAPRLARALALATAAVLALSACASNAPQAGAGGADAEQVVRWAVTQPFATWDPIVAGSTASTRFLTPIYESLTSIDETGALAPGLAESWEYNDAGDAVTFHLRPNQTFHDGTAVDAAAIAAFIERAKTQANSALAGDYATIDTVTVDDDLTLTVHLTQVDYQIPYLLSVRGALITSAEAGAADPDRLNVSEPIGAGPFKVVELVPESRIVLEKFDDYWDADNIHIDRIEIEFGIDGSTIVKSLQTGVYNFAFIEAKAVKEAQDAALDVWFGDEYAWFVNFLSININKEPFTDPAVVEAIKHAIDRDELVDKVTLGHGKAVDQPFPPGYIAYDEESEDVWDYDPAKAADILSDAGYEPGDVSVSLSISAENPSAEIIQEQLGEIGIEVTIDIDPNWRVGYFGKGTALALYGYFGRDSHVQALTANYDRDGVLNLSSPYVSEEFTTALRRIRETPLDSPDYARLLREATRAGVATSPTVHLYTVPAFYAKSPEVSDLPTIQGQLSWKGVTVGG